MRISSRAAPPAKTRTTHSFTGRHAEQDELTDDTFSPPFGGDSEDERPLPDHEYDEIESVGGGVLGAGGGVLGAGGTATDRGTGTLEGQAQTPRHSGRHSGRVIYGCDAC